jgi:acyl dehydratase
MPLNADIAGRHLPEQEMLVTPRMALAYAAGIGDESDVCYDDERPDFMAHPAFCVTPEWRLVTDSRTRRLGMTHDETIRGVHAGQNTRFIKPIRPGMTLRLSGQVIDVRPTRAGGLVRTRLEIADARSGEALSSTITTAMYRGVDVVGNAVHDPSTHDVTEDWTEPTESSSTAIPLDRFFAHRYSECADIWNPIHTEQRVAHAAGLRGIIVHGTALWALAGREIIRRYAPGEPWRLSSLNGRFSAMVMAGEPITICHGAGRRPGEIMFTVLNAAGHEAVSRGIAGLD